MIGDSISFKVAFNPENTTDKTVVWTSENDKIAMVSTDGVLTGKSVGETTITANHKNISDSFVIKVNPIPTEDIIITPQDSEYNTNSGSYQLEKEQQIQFSAEVLPENTTDKTVVWSVSDESIATIDQNGLLTGIGTGSVVVIATTKDGVKSEFEVNVYSNTAAMAGTGVTAVAVGAGIALYLKKRKNKK